MKKLGHFLMGAATALCLIGFQQDFLGLEGYIQYVRATWVHYPAAGWFIWIAVLLLIDILEVNWEHIHGGK